MEIILYILPFLILVFIALTYNSTVTPTVKWLGKSYKKVKGLTPVDRSEKQKPIMLFGRNCKPLFSIIFFLSLLSVEFDVLDYFGRTGELLWPIVYLVLAVACGWFYFSNINNEKSDSDDVWLLIGGIIFAVLFIDSFLPYLK